MAYYKQLPFLSECYYFCYSSLLQTDLSANNNNFNYSSLLQAATISITIPYHKQVAFLLEFLISASYHFYLNSLLQPATISIWVPHYKRLPLLLQFFITNSYHFYQNFSLQTNTISNIIPYCRQIQFQI